MRCWVVGCWCGCLGWGADLHIAQHMPLPLTISCSSKSRLVLTFLVLPFCYLLTRVVPDKLQKSSKMVVSVCVWWGAGVVIWLEQSANDVTATHHLLLDKSWLKAFLFGLFPVISEVVAWWYIIITVVFFLLSKIVIMTNRVFVIIDDVEPNRSCLILIAAACNISASNRVMHFRQSSSNYMHRQLLVKMLWQ